jgi:hypothetical protein
LRGIEGTILMGEEGGGAVPGIENLFPRFSGLEPYCTRSSVVGVNSGSTSRVMLAFTNAVRISSARACLLLRRGEASAEAAKRERRYVRIVI